MIFAVGIKSAELLSVSAQPSALRIALVVLLRVVVGPVPSKSVAALPNPTKSMMAAFGRQRTVPPQLSSAVVLTSATLPAVDDMAILPDASGVGKGWPFTPPLLSCTRK